MAKTLSLIVPFFNEFTYLTECLDSIRAQALGDRVQIIVVNDNPGERADAFVERAAARYGAELVRHEVNRGLSAARNSGMDAAEGDLTTFLDSDDYYTSDGLARHIAFAEEQDADIAHAPTIVKTLRGETRHVAWDGKLFLDRRTGVDLATFPAAQFIASSWSSIYRTSFLRDRRIRFDEAQRRFEDRLFVLEAVMPARSIALLGADDAGPVRVYRRRPGSITTAAKEGEDRMLQAQLSRKCVDLIAGAVAAGRAAPECLEREVMVCLQRLLMNTGLADAALDGDAEAEAARDVFAGLFADHPLTGSIWGDAVFAPLHKMGDHFEDGRPVARADFEALHDAVRESDWTTAGRLYETVKLPPQPRKPLGGAARKAELVLHVGLHKTGTTHVQRLLEANRPALADRGVLFPKIGFRPLQPMNARARATPGHLGVVHAIQNENTGFAEKLYSEIDAFHDGAGPDKVLISAENMSNPLRADRGRRQFVSQADDFFAGLPKRRVIALIRRPDRFMDAYYRELVFLGTDHWRKSPDRFAFEHGDMATDMHAMFRRWIEFADGEIALASYEEAKGAGVETAVLSLAGIDGVTLTSRGGGGVAGPNAAAATYPTPTRSEVAAARAIAAATPPGPARSRAIACFWRISRDARDETDGPLLSPLIRRLMIEKMQASSAEFLAAHGVHPPFDRWLAEIDAEDEPPPAALSAAHMELAQSALELSRMEIDEEPARASDLAADPPASAGIGDRIVSLFRKGATR